MHRTAGKTDRKAKKSYSLSPESVKFLEVSRKERHAASVSAVLEELLQSARDEHERASMERAVADYYTSLSGKETAERAEWGEFAEREFPAQGRL